jgi:ribosomal-protein-alanine N-acetyltransferase
MHWFSSLLGLSPRTHLPSLDTQLIGPRVYLRLATSEDWKEWRALREQSRAFLTPWEPQWPYNALSYAFYTNILRRHWREWRAGKTYAFTIFRHDGAAPVLVGGITLGDVVYAEAEKGTIGYWIGEPYAGQGLMTEAVGLVCDFAFNRLRLTRIEAGCLPHNEPSRALLRRMGFELEGYAKAYLQINGRREDHLLWGKSNPHLPQGFS